MTYLCYEFFFPTNLVSCLHVFHDPISLARFLVVPFENSASMASSVVDSAVTLNYNNPWEPVNNNVQCLVFSYHLK